MFQAISKGIGNTAPQLWQRGTDKLSGRGRAHFLHIGKTGGTAIKDALSGIVTEQYRVVLHAHGFTMHEVPKGEKFFFFVRDPLKRFVSGFYSRQRQGQPRYFSAWNHAEEQAFSRFSTPNELALGLHSASADVRAAAEDAMRSIQHVRDSYWKWFGYEGDLLGRIDDILFVGAQEQLNEDFKALQNILGIASSVALPRDPVTAHRNPADVDRSLCGTATEILQDWYKEDYKLLDLLALHFDHLPAYR